MQKLQEAKSNQNSGVEALSLFETFIHDASVYAFYQKLAYDNAWMDKQDVEEALGADVYRLLQQTILFEIENEQWGTRHIISFDLTLPEQPKRTFIISEYIPSSRTSPIVLMAFFEDLKKTFTVDYPTVEQVYTEQVLTVPSHLYY